MYIYYGCLPGGEVTVKLKSGDFTLGTEIINVIEPSEYTALTTPPGPGFHCQVPQSSTRTKVSNHSKTINSIGGYTHTATAEIWEGLMTLSVGPFANPTLQASTNRCIEARIINESSPGTTQRSWTGMLYLTQTALQTPVVDIDALIAGDFGDFISLFANQDPRVDGALEREVNGNCALCRGGTIQTNQLVREGGTIKHYTVHVFSQHTFVSGSEGETIDLAISQQISPITTLNGPGYVSAVVAELVSLGLEYTLDKLIELANWIIMNI